MRLSVRNLACGAVIGLGATAALILMQQVPDAVADELTAKSLLDDLSVGHVFDPGKLVKLNDDVYSVNIDPGVSGAASERHTIRKIAMGRTSLVEVVTTPTGTYSTDGLASPYIRYPGIEVERLGPAKPYWMGGVLSWSDERGWVPVPLVDAHSFSVLGASRGALIETTPHGTCVKTKTTRVCV